MDAKEIANQLTGTNYPLRLGAELIEQAKSAGLVIVYGASDDLMILNGCIHDEFGCYDGGTAFIDEKGLLPERENIEDDEELEEFFSRKPKAKSIEALWCEGEYTWSYKTDIPHETFEILDDDEKYCRGLVFSISDIRFSEWKSNIISILIERDGWTQQAVESIDWNAWKTCYFENELNPEDSISEEYQAL